MYHLLQFQNFNLHFLNLLLKRVKIRQVTSSNHRHFNLHFLNLLLKLYNPEFVEKDYYIFQSSFSESTFETIEEPIEEIEEPIEFQSSFSEFIL